MLTLSLRKRIKSKRIPTAKIDELLEEIGLIRHVVPRDGNSLFRCISQCVFFTQSCYLAVRQHLLQFSTLQTEEFSKMTEISVNSYEKKITDRKLDGELLDMHIAAKFYKINIVFYVDALPFVPLIITTPDAVKTLNVCLNYEGTYDLVLAKEVVVNISFCQTIMYKMLYHDVFKLSGVDFAVKKMLFDRSLQSTKSNDQESLEKRATCTDMKELLENGIIPFPFKVAKALTPNLYRNTEYDIWMNNKKDKFLGRCNNWEFKEGSQCMVLIGSQWCHCYIQRIRGKNEPVEVYVRDLAKKIDVDFKQLRLTMVEYDARETINSHVQVDQVSSSTDIQLPEQYQNPIQYNSSSFIQRQAIHGGVFPGPLFSPLSYIHHPYQYLHAVIPPNLVNNGNLMCPLYLSATPPPILSNDFCPPTVNASPGLPSMSQCWYCSNNPTSTPCSCEEYNNDEESGVTMDSNHAYQPWLIPEFNEPADELQQ
ncbi:Hypothetical protein CINCED_3A011930 [Cinara cedri]|uniref:Uncharacterized protein n=1 Tax=Cinara cedri TaxID=506608 RepID=A0A5E4M9P4_9HEMI|nr:Hypothetical protein CINCED_3A011930 [Cinara cedri]